MKLALQLCSTHRRARKPGEPLRGPALVRVLSTAFFASLVAARLASAETVPDRVDLGVPALAAADGSSSPRSGDPQGCVPSFSDIGAGLPGVGYSSVAWGDYDNDGDLDLLLTGVDSPGIISRVYRNSGGANPTFSDIGAGLRGVYYSSAAWGDYDNDGDLDILLAGRSSVGDITALYRNSGGANPTFSEVGTALQGVGYASAAWGDYDNDGDLDILLTGLDNSGAYISKVAPNIGGNIGWDFSSPGPLTGVMDGSVAWGDYDNDGDLDILLTGNTGAGYISKVYRNSGGANPTFSDIGAGLTGVRWSSVAWGDYDNDGDLDVLLTGNTGAASISKLYRNSGGANPTFSDIGAGLTGVYYSSVAWGDYDNDGDLDILLMGYDGSVFISKVYGNSGGANPTFGDAGAGLTGVLASSAAWGDYDNDGDLDILLTGDTGAAYTSKLYRNTSCVPNTPPSAPGGLSAGAPCGSGAVTLSWSPASDAQTPANGLTYNLRVGRTPGGSEVSSAMASSAGYRRVARLGNTNHDETWTLRLAPGTHYWSVQALDGAFAGSAFAPEQSFIVAGLADMGAGLTSVRESSVAWGDYDNDGDLDILLTGDTGAGFISKLYRNSGGANPTFSDIGAGLTGVYRSSVAWGDYDNDGDLDILLTGDTGAGYVSKVYRNGGGANPTFSDIGAGLTGVNRSSVAWGDYDNDGDLDILLTGLGVAGSVSKVYRNSGGANPTFSDIAAGLAGAYRSSVALGDYDNDGDLDILLTGLGVAGSVSKVYRNSGGANPTFSDIGAGLTGVEAGSVAWGDYDNDGDLDILITGIAGSAPMSRVYRNSGGTNPVFSGSGVVLTGVDSGSVAWGDYDNDGDLDILLTGSSSSALVSKVYGNSGGANPTFSDIGAGLTGVYVSSVAWGDFDNDGDLDMMLTGGTGPGYTSKLYRNITCVTNTPPSAPAGLADVCSSPGAVMLSWSPASDAQTPANGLTYNLRVGRTPGGSQVSSAMASSAGYRRVAGLGNTNHEMTWRLGPLAGTYYWSVQAVDGAFAGSAFAPEQSFTVGPPFAPDTGAGLAGVWFSSVAWGDYDNDGDLDIVLTGANNSAGDSFISRVYRNSGGANPTFSDIGAGLTDVYYSSVAWGDYDNDGDLDILLTGFNDVEGNSTISKLYRNGGGANPTFSDIGAGLAGVSGSAAWGDYDNDGDLDILLTGYDTAEGAVSKVYRNSGGADPTFGDIGAGLTGVYSPSIAWGDYDNDGDLDILLTGDTDAGSISRIYRNGGGADPTFSDIGAALAGVSQGSVAWGDYDNDGDLDILLSGDTGAGYISRVYRNGGGADPTFSDIGAALIGVYASSVAWGDYDNDGDLDILLTGNGSSGIDLVSAVYRNSGGANPTFSYVFAGLTGVRLSSVAWGDYDNDGDLDILLTGDSYPTLTASVYRNTSCLPNTPPSAPGGLTRTTGPAGTTFSWNAASDAQTPAAGLTYNLRVGTTPYGNEISSAMAAAGGYREVAQLGNANHRLSWTLALPPVNCYWSVQAVDGAFAGSPFAAGLPTVDVPVPAPIPGAFALHANRPNPFSGTTRIGFDLPREAGVRVRVYDVSGRRIGTLADGGRLPAGRHEVEWDGRGPRGERVHDGVYFYLMETDGFRSIRRMVLAR